MIGRSGRDRDQSDVGRLGHVSPEPHELGALDWTGNGGIGVHAAARSHGTRKPLSATASIALMSDGEPVEPLTRRLGVPAPPLRKV